MAGTCAILIPNYKTPRAYLSAPFSSSLLSFRSFVYRQYLGGQDSTAASSLSVINPSYVPSQWELKSKCVIEQIWTYLDCNFGIEGICIDMICRPTSDHRQKLTSQKTNKAADELALPIGLFVRESLLRG